MIETDGFYNSGREGVPVFSNDRRLGYVRCEETRKKKLCDKANVETEEMK